MPLYDGRKLAQEGLLNVAQHCIQAALHAPSITGRTEIRSEVLTGEEVNNLFEAENTMHMQGVYTTGENISRAAAKFGEPPIIVLIGADCKPLLRAPCRAACPAEIDIPRQIRLIGDGKYDQAAQVIREKAPFPGVLGRVCRAPCEEKCRRGVSCDQPIAIRPLHRFATDLAGKDAYIASPSKEATGKKVAIIGSGPAGLTAAYFLQKVCGHSVTVFEALPEPGGMMRFGIPEYRLPKDILTTEINTVREAGVEIKTNTKIDSVDNLLKEGFDAVLVAVGTHKSTRMDIEGEDLRGVINGIDFLRDVNLGKKVDVGEKVAVIGGGNVAIDAARSAIRLGAKEVHLACLESRDKMPSFQSEIESAEAEGVAIHCCWAPQKIVSKGHKVTGIDFAEVQSVEFDKEGKIKWTLVEGSKQSIEVDSLISAIGQSPDCDFLAGVEGLKLNSRGRVAVDQVAFTTNLPAVFASGDVVSGPASVIEAIASARKAASAIDKYLGGVGRIDDVIAPSEVVPDIRKAQGEEKERPQLSKQLFNKDQTGMTEVELALTEEQALGEDLRCLKCDTVGFDCGACGHQTCRAAVAYTNDKMIETGGEPWGWIWKGPSCIWRIMELGIAADWAAAASHNYNVGTRNQMVPGGVCLRIGYLEDCTAALCLAIGPCVENWYFEPGSGNEELLPYSLLQTRQRLAFTPLWIRFGGPGRDMGMMGIKTQDNWWDAPYTKADIVTDNDWWKFIWNRDYSIFETCDQIRAKRGVNRLNLPAIKKTIDKKINQAP